MKEKAGKRFFVQVDAANVRIGPSMKSEILFQVGKGGAVTVMDKRQGWYSIKMDDGRAGWMYHTLLKDALAPGQDGLPAIREIRSIHVDPPVNGVGKVVFKLSGPYAPETLVIDGNKPRIACDFLETSLASDIASRIDIQNGMIQTIRTGLHTWPRSKIRVVLDLVSGQHYELMQATAGDDEDSFVLEIKAVSDS